MKIFKQLLIILVINFAGELISETLSEPLPGSIIGMLILLILLLTGLVKEKHIAETATFLLDNMPFFFIPAGVSVMVSYQFLDGHLAATISTIVLSTLFVMIVTGLVTQFLIKSKKDD
ncbi:CidA/LrgA family protein [Carboxylicivirga linearis]|uniref:CidA/LrgA family protein n=1 Tax=Carboxylicivirga linearis TaxID=1628157 RepID=A0ABS5JRU8_9BACT|nr:CidA/LrgA family protein [Carboxylicivirga linearis]MBS2097594.1 CidA/LrgA family protein [Carboxylicivirga linearis]